MKKALSSNYITKIIICQFLLCLGVIFGTPKAEAAKVDDFTFSSFEADYYLTSDAEKNVKMRVVETLTAEFPEQQNKGICREIPYLNDGDRIVVLDGLTSSDIKLTRNGEREPIYSIEKEDGFYRVCTGTEEYVEGTQAYRFEYTFENVIINRTSAAGQPLQELYWDTNGNGWRQPFEQLTVRVHLEKPELWTGRSSCYVGAYGENNGQCTTTKIDDGIQFATGRLERRENLTFDLEFNPDTFKVVEPEKNYLAYLALAVFIAFAAFKLYEPIKEYRATSELRQYYKGYFVKPEYAPDAKYSLTESAAIYKGKLKDVKVAILLDLIVKKKVELVNAGKGIFGKTIWKIKIVDYEHTNNVERNVLKILNRGDEIHQGDEIDLKKTSVKASMISLSNRVDAAGVTEAVEHGLVKKGFSKNPSTESASVLVIFESVLLFQFITIALPVLFTDSARSDFPDIFYDGVAYVHALAILIVCLAITLISSIIRSVIRKKVRAFDRYEKRGLEYSRYLDGLKLYINMAEKDRIDYFQSTTGAALTNEGIVELYEKLLPYAALFGLEESWMKELGKYYQIENIETPSWVGVNLYSTTVLGNVNRATYYSNHSSSGSSHSSFSSSSHSGGGGGGFSGGGGGGGGGGGR